MIYTSSIYTIPVLPFKKVDWLLLLIFFFNAE